MNNAEIADITDASQMVSAAKEDGWFGTQGWEHPICIGHLRVWKMFYEETENEIFSHKAINLSSSAFLSLSTLQPLPP